MSTNPPDVGLSHGHTRIVQTELPSHACGSRCCAIKLVSLKFLYRGPRPSIAALPLASAVRLCLTGKLQEICGGCASRFSDGGVASNSNSLLVGKAQPYRTGQRQSRRNRNACAL